MDLGRRARRLLVLIATVGCLLAGTISVATSERAAIAADRPFAQLGGHRILGWGFAAPTAVSTDGTHLWVTNQENSVTEVDASTLVGRGIAGSGYGLDSPAAVSSDASHVWVANVAGNSMTELDASTGAVVQVISGPSFGFNQPDAVSSDGAHVWIANFAGNSVTELDASTGALVQLLSGPGYPFSNPRAVSSDGAHVWVVGADAVTELDASTGGFVKYKKGPQNGFNRPDAVSSDGTHVWIANAGGNSVTELNASTAIVVGVRPTPATSSTTPWQSHPTAPTFGWPTK